MGVDYHSFLQGNLLDSEMERASLASSALASGLFPTEPSGKPTGDRSRITKGDEKSPRRVVKRRKSYLIPNTVRKHFKVSVKG